MSKEKNLGGVQLDKSFGDRMISVLTYVIYAIFAFVCVYPFYYIFINSISANDLSERGKVILYPMQIHFSNYASVFKIPGLLDAAQISVLRTVIGTVLHMLFMNMAAYVLSRRYFYGRSCACFRKEKRVRTVRGFTRRGQR